MIRLCTNCGLSIEPHDHLAPVGVYACRSCKQVYSERLEQEDLRYRPVSNSQQLGALAPMTKPGSVEMDLSDNRLRISVLPETHGLYWPLGLVGGGLFVLLGVLAVGWPMLINPAGLGGYARAGALLVVGGGMLSVGLWLSQPLLSLSRHRPRLWIEASKLGVDPGPAPNVKRRLDDHAIEQIHWKKIPHHRKGGPPSFTYDLLASVRVSESSSESTEASDEDGSAPGHRRFVRLWGYLTRPEDTIFVTQQLRGFLNLDPADETQLEEEEPTPPPPAEAAADDTNPDQASSATSEEGEAGSPLAPSAASLAESPKPTAPAQADAAPATDQPHQPAAVATSLDEESSQSDMNLDVSGDQANDLDIEEIGSDDEEPFDPSVLEDDSGIELGDQR
jgi:hypothetical protein